jgi:tetratricopeptide (TPR) repeat protein
VIFNFKKISFNFRGCKPVKNTGSRLHSLISNYEFLNNALPAMIFIVCAAFLFYLFHARPAGAQSIEKISGFKPAGSITAGPLLFKFEDKLSIIFIRGSEIFARRLDDEGILWKSDIKSAALSEMFICFDRSKILLLYQDKTFDIIEVKNGKIIYAEKNQNAVSAICPSTTGFIFVKNNFAYEFGRDKSEKLDIEINKPVLHIGSLVTDSGFFYYSFIFEDRFIIYGGGANAKNSRVISRGALDIKTACQLLYFNLKDGSEFLKLALCDGDAIKIFDCSPEIAVNKIVIKTGGGVTSLCGAGGLSGGAAALVTSGGPFYRAYDEEAGGLIFKAEAPAARGFLPALAGGPGEAGPLIFYYGAPDRLCVSDLKTQARLADYKLAAAAPAGYIEGFCGSADKSMLIITEASSGAPEFLNFNLNQGAAAFKRDFYFSAGGGFACAPPDTIASKASSAATLYSIALKTFNRWYSDYPVLTGGAAVFILALTAWLIFGFKRRAGAKKQSGAAGSKDNAAAGDEIEKLKSLSEKYIINEEYEKAAGAFKELIEKDKAGNINKYYGALTGLYYKMSMHEDAVEIFRVAAELKSGFIDSALPEINGYFEESVERGNKKLIMLYGDCVISAYIKRKNTAAAIAAIDKILKLYPQTPALIKRKAFMMIENDGCADNAYLADIFAGLYKSFPQETRIKYEYCRLLGLNGRYDDCISLLLDALENIAATEDKTGFIDLFSALADKLIKEKEFGRIIDAAPDAYKLCGANIFLKILAEAYLKSGDPGRANDIYIKALQKDPQDAAALKRQKYIQSLVEECDLLAMKNPGGPAFEVIIDGEAVKIKNKTDGAAQTTVQAEGGVKIYLAEAKLHYERGDYGKAASLFQAALKAAPEDKNAPAVKLRLMQCFYKLRMPEQAEKLYDSIDFKKISASRPEETGFKYRAALVFMENGALEKARDLLGDIAAFDIGYEKNAELIEKVNKLIAAREGSDKTVIGEGGADGPSDDERTVIAEAATEADYINTRYRIEAMIGRGGMGAVYKAFDIREKREVAVKIPILKFKNDSNFIKRFEREADISARLRHPNIIETFEVVKGELPYMVMELICGLSLKQALKEKKCFGHIMTRDIAVQCCEALDYTHGLNIIHRDIKPENIMLLAGDKIKLMDFGLSKALDDSALTKAGSIIGTFAYISPEQCLGEKVDARADIYSLGIMFYEMLTGEKPFASGDYVDHHIKTRPPALTKKKPGIPYPVEIIVLKCLEKKPQDRFSSAAELKAAWLKII